MYTLLCQYSRNASLPSRFRGINYVPNRTFSLSPGATVRLQKILASAGFGSRRACEKIIEDGHVLVNGHVAALGQKACPKSDDIVVYGECLSSQMEKSASSQPVVFAVHKPRGVVSSMKDPQGRPCLSDYCPPSYPRMFHVGRLDINSEGLIFLTNDGDWAQRIAHPSMEIRKLYHAVVTAENVQNGDILGIPERLMRSVALEDGLARAVRAQWIVLPTLLKSRPPNSTSFLSSQVLATSRRHRSSSPDNGQQHPSVFKDEMEFRWMQDCDPLEESDLENTCGSQKAVGRSDKDPDSNEILPGVMESLMVAHKYKILEDMRSLRIHEGGEEYRRSQRDHSKVSLSRKGDADNVISAGIIEIELTEGRHRIVRRMLESADLKVRRLMRMAIGGLGIGRKHQTLGTALDTRTAEHGIRHVIPLADPGTVVKLTPHEIHSVLEMQ